MAYWSKYGWRTDARNVYVIAAYVCMQCVYMAHCIATGTQGGCVWHTLQNAECAAHMQLQIVSQHERLLRCAVDLWGSYALML